MDRITQNWVRCALYPGVPRNVPRTFRVLPHFSSIPHPTQLESGGHGSGWSSWPLILSGNTDITKINKTQNWIFVSAKLESELPRVQSGFSHLCCFQSRKSMLQNEGDWFYITEKGYGTAPRTGLWWCVFRETNTTLVSIYPGKQIRCCSVYPLVQFLQGNVKCHVPTLWDGRTWHFETNKSQIVLQF